MAQEDVSRFEKMPTRIYPDAASASRAVAEEIAQLIKQRQAEGRKVRAVSAAGLTPAEATLLLVVL
jgi:glucosamine-6-phosphate deaminase